MNVKPIFEKVKNSAKKISKKTWIACGAVLVVGLAVLLNVLFLPENDTNKDGVIDPVLDLSNVSAMLTQMENEQNESSVSTFSEMTLSRQQARDEAMEVLKNLANSDSATDDVKQDAASEIEDIAACIEREANIESLIKAKGFEECIAVISENSASVIVKTEGLAQNQIAQISEIVYTQTGIHPTNLNIIESN